MKLSTIIMTDYPSDAILIERGKYATLRSEHRKRQRELQERMIAITDQARLLLRFDDAAEQAEPTYQAMLRQVGETGVCLTALSELQIALNALRPAAWGGKGESE